MGAVGVATGTLAVGQEKAGEDEFRIMTLDPGHFHAALVQKRMFPDVAKQVHVYAPKGSDLQQHLARIESFNSRSENPTSWQTKVYVGDDFLEKMLAEKPGNVVVLAGNNGAKTRYILESVKAGLNVLSDKPMAITPKDFELLQEAYAIADEKGLLINDIMTERHEITTQLQRFFAQESEFFGEIDQGSPEDPAVTKESVHHFYKMVAGAPLVRPAWFYDVTQQGEGIVDVTTHLVDLVQWGLFPEQVLGLDEAKVLSARTWDTKMTPAEFTKSTNVPAFPDYLKGNLDDDGNLLVACNGEFVFELKGVHAKISVIWNYVAPEGAADTHFSLMRGSKVAAIIRQGAEQEFKPVLYLEPREGVEVEDLQESLQVVAEKAAAKWPGVEVVSTDKGWEVKVPEKYHVGHEAHFSQVAESFVNQLKTGEMPVWEVPNTLAKYRTIMDAYKKSR